MPSPWAYAWANWKVLSRQRSAVSSRFATTFWLFWLRFSGLPTDHPTGSAMPRITGQWDQQPGDFSPFRTHQPPNLSRVARRGPVVNFHCFWSSLQVSLGLQLLVSPTGPKRRLLVERRKRNRSGPDQTHFRLVPRKDIPISMLKDDAPQKLRPLFVHSCPARPASTPNAGMQEMFGA